MRSEFRRRSRVKRRPSWIRLTWVATVLALLAMTACSTGRTRYDAIDGPLQTPSSFPTSSGWMSQT